MKIWLVLYFGISTFIAFIQAFYCSNGVQVHDHYRCSNKTDCDDCSDEIGCPNQKNFHPCLTGIGTVRCFSEEQRCNGVKDCSNCTDELGCPNSPFFICNDGSGCVEFKQHFCNGQFDCVDHSDETRKGFGFKCTSGNSLHGTKCIVPQRHLGTSLQSQHQKICENEAEKCFVMTNGTKIIDSSVCWTCLDGTIIQRIQMCDGVFDCPDLSDECLCLHNKVTDVCDAIAEKGCNFDEIYCPHQKKCIKIRNICDDEHLNCWNESDQFHEQHCGLSCEPESISFMEDGCANSSYRKPYQRAFKCNGVIECRHAEDECHPDCRDHLFYPICDIINEYTEIVNFHDDSNCSRPLKVNQLCNDKKDCDDGIDEKYCSNIQLCDPNYPDSGSYDNTQCGPDRCNFAATCDNIADELNCSERTHFYCDGNRKFIAQWQRFDGTFDCADFSDECDISSAHISSPTELIRTVPLRVCLWILMLLSLSGNGIVICKTILDLYNAVYRRLHCSINRVGVCNKIMILNLAISDFLMGIYLFIIAVKSVEFSGRYCEVRQDWLMSSTCSFAGILAVVSSEASVLLMVLMTSYRLYGFTNPFNAEKLGSKIIYFATGIIWIFSLLLGIIPVLQTNFASTLFVNQPYGSNSFTISDLSNIFKKAKRLPVLNNSISGPTDLSVSTFCNLFVSGVSMPDYCENPDEVMNATSGYYGSDGVCLPRYYGSSDEPASQYSFGLVTLNFAAFIYMFFAYLYIYRSTSLGAAQQGDAHSSKIDENRSKENQALWGKIMRLIVTDFICWVPICVMSFISFAGEELPDIVYPITAILLVPINSAANPWLYSSFLVGYVQRLWQYLSKLSRKKTRRIGNKKAKTGEIMRNHGNSSVSFRQMSRLELMASSPSSAENTANEIVTVATDV